MRWMKGSAVAAGLAAVGIGALMAHPALRDYVYREGSYAVMLERIAPGERDPVRLTRQTVRFVHDTLYPGGGPVIDTDAWTDLVRGIGWCDQQDWTVATLLALRGVPGRLVMLDNEAGKSLHTVMEVHLDGEWRLVDPLYGLMFTRPDGALATREDLSSDLTLLTGHPILLQMAPAARQKVIEQYAGLFPIRLPPRVWSSVLESRAVSRPKVWLARAAQRGWTIGGPAWSAALQDVYFLWPVSLDELATEINLEHAGNHSRQDIRQAYQWYVQARNYHLYGRWRKAAAGYRRIIAAYPDLAIAQRSAAWLGLAQLEGGDPGAVQTLQRFVDDHPQDTWSPRVLDGLARAYDRQGDRQAADAATRLAVEDPYNPAAQRAAERFMTGAASLRVQ